MKWLAFCLFLVACDSMTAPFYTRPDCPEGQEVIEWSKRDSLGVETHGYWCVEAGSWDSLFGALDAPVQDSTGSITLIICVDGVCPDGTVVGDSVGSG